MLGTALALGRAKARRETTNLGTVQHAQKKLTSKNVPAIFKVRTAAASASRLSHSRPEFEGAGRESFPARLKSNSKLRVAATPAFRRPRQLTAQPEHLVRVQQPGHDEHPQAGDDQGHRPSPAVQREEGRVEKHLGHEVFPIDVDPPPHVADTRRQEVVLVRPRQIEAE
jgi:hypothetical protein